MHIYIYIYIYKNIYIYMMICMIMMTGPGGRGAWRGCASLAARTCRERDFVTDNLNFGCREQKDIIAIGS